MQAIFRHVEAFMAIDRPTIIVVCVMCGLAAWILKEYLATPPMAIFVFPLLVGLSLIVHYLILLAEIYPNNKLDQWLMWTIVAGICGNIMGIGLVAAFSNMREAKNRRRT